MPHPLVIWAAAFLLGVALGIAIAAFIPGWSPPARLVVPRTFRPISDDLRRQQEENAIYYKLAALGHRTSLDWLGARAGRVTLLGNAREMVTAWPDKRARDHASVLYDNAARVFAVPAPASTLGQELSDNA